MEKATPPPVGPKEPLILSNADGEFFFPYAQIVSIEADDATVTVHTLPGGVFDAKIVFTISLSKVQNMLDPKLFLRTHHSWLVNMQHVCCRGKGKETSLLMKSKQRVPVARSKKEPVRDALHLFNSTNG